MSISELQTLRTDVQNLLNKVLLADVFALVQAFPFCKGAQLEKYRQDFLNSHFPHNFSIYLQQLSLFLNGCIDNEIACLQAIEKVQQEAKKWFDAGCDATDLEAEISAYDKAISLNLNYADAYKNRGFAKHGLGNYQEAIEDYNKAIALNSKDADVYNSRAAAKCALDKFSEGIEDFNKCILLEPERADAYTYRGLAKYDLGKYQEAIEDFNKAITLDSEDVDAYTFRARVKCELGKYIEAIEDCNKAIALDPKEANIRCFMACLYAELKNKQGVLSSLREAIRLDASIKDEVKDFSEFSWIENDSDFQALVR